MAGLCLLTGSVILSLKVYLGESYTDVLIPHNQLPHAKHFSLKEQVCVHLCVCVCVHVGTHTSVCVYSGWSVSRDGQAYFCFPEILCDALYQVPIIAGSWAPHFLEFMMLKRGEGITRHWRVLQPLFS